MVENKHGSAQHRCLSAQTTVVHSRIKPQQALKYLICFFQSALLIAQPHNVYTHPKHRHRGVMPLVCRIHRADSVVRFFYLALLSQFKYVLHFHSIAPFPLMFTYHKDNKKYLRYTIQSIKN